MLNISNLMFPAGSDSRLVDWAELPGGEYGEPGYTSAEAFTFEHEGTDWTMIGQDGSVTHVLVNGELLDDNELVDHIDDLDEVEGTEDEAALLQAARDALDTAQYEGADAQGAEGPIMNFFWAITDSGDIAEMALMVADLPVCVVEIGNEIGLALTGGGMDLSWEIAEAYVRLGYRPPVTLDLPGMAGRGTSDDDQAIVRAVIEAKRVAADNLNRAATDLAKRYGAPLA